MSGLRVDGVTKAFGPVTVLRGVDLAVEQGTLCAVLGRSGCGKTTLLRLVAGFDRPDAGTVEIDGREVAGPSRVLPPEDRGIGYVTQDGNLFPHLTVAANVGFGLRRRDRRGARVGELLDLLGLGDLGARHPHQLSGGQQQRVALARALARDPRIVLLDEPFSALDAELRETTRTAVARALAALGTTTVLVTHDRAEALSLADRVAVMVDGRIVQQATPQELYRHPVDRSVAAFVGDVVAVPGVVAGGTATSPLGMHPVAGARADGPATLLLRPEQIALGGANGQHSGRVTGIEFYGHDAVVGLAVTGLPGVVARCPGHLLPAVGDVVGLAVTGPVVAVDEAPTAG